VASISDTVCELAGIHRLASPGTCTALSEFFLQWFQASFPGRHLVQALKLDGGLEHGSTSHGAPKKHWCSVGTTPALLEKRVFNFRCHAFPIMRRSAAAVRHSAF